MASATDVQFDLPTPPRAAGARGRAPRWLTAVVLAIGLAFLTPFAYLVVRNAGDVGGFVRATTSGRTVLPLLRSLLLATSVAATSAVVGTATAWLVVRTDLPGRRVWRLLLPLPLVIPSFIGAFALIAAFAPGGLADQLLPATVELPQVRGFVAAWLVLTLFTFPYVFLPVAARLGQLSSSLEEAARLLGRRPGQVFRQIVLPQIRGAILVGALLTFLYAISDWGAVELLRYDTLTRRIFATMLFDQPTSLALSLQLGVLALTVVGLARTVARRGERGAPPRSVEGLHVRLHRWRWPAFGLVGGVTALSLLAPVAVLGFWALRGLLRDTSRASALVGDVGALLDPAISTAVVSVVTAAAAVVIVLPVAYAVVRFRSRAAPAAHSLVTAGFALPGLVIALSLVFLLIRTPIYQTFTVLVFGYLVHFGAQAVTAAEVAVRSVPTRLDEAARVLGASRWRRLWRVELPLMVPGLLAGGGLVLLSTMKELPATLLLAPPGFETLATRIWAATEDAFLADASLASLVLITLSGILTWILVVRRSSALQ